MDENGRPLRNQWPWQWGLLLALALSIRLAAAAAWECRYQGGLVFGDSVSYWHLAKAIAHGETYQYGDYGRVFRTPGYPMLLSPLFWLFGESPPYFAARAIGAVLGTLGAVATGWLATLLWDSRTGWYAALLAAIHPECVLSSVPILSEAAFCPIWVVHLACLAAMWRCAGTRQAWTWATGAGVTAGLAILIRPSALLWPPLLFLVAMMRDFRAKSLAPLALSTGLIVVVLLPWWIRNYRATGHWIPTTTQVGASLYDGCNPHANGASNMDFVTAAIQATKSSLGDRGKHPGIVEIEVDHRLRNEALRWVAANPFQFVRLAGVKLRRFWSPVPNEGTFNRFPFNLILATAFLSVIALAVTGLIRGTLGWAAFFVCWLPTIYFTLLHMVFVSSVRYRQPVMFGLIAAAAPVLASAIDVLRSRWGIALANGGLSRSDDKHKARKHKSR